MYLTITATSRIEEEKRYEKNWQYYMGTGFDILWKLIAPIIIAVIGIKMIFGGIDNKKHQNSNDNQYTVYLNGTCIFGGATVK